MKKLQHVLLLSAAALAVAAIASRAQTQAPPQAQTPAQSQAPAPPVQTSAPPAANPPATIGATPAAVRQSGEDPGAVARGQEAYASAGCGSCHGATAKGTDTGTDLIRSPLVEDDTKGELIGPVLTQPHPKVGGAKPNLTDQQISDIAAWLRVQVYGAAMRDTYTYLNIVVGDPQKGEAFFNGAGKCNTCHSVTGDLAGIGSKYAPPQLQSLWISGGANARFGRGLGRGLLTANGGMLADTSPPAITPSTITITVTLADGQKFTGVPVSYDDFHVAFRDMSGAYHSFDRRGEWPKVEVHNPLQPHWDLLKHLTDDEMHNVTAYLVTLK
ncbi:MAG TPA: c-type cytochrome [Candidatus Acidoferrales bacterium]|nr:c-type cytochrome [Candidatus Acidoferrales bacterium]